jgi:hypothetical protein
MIERLQIEKDTTWSVCFILNTRNSDEYLEKNDIDSETIKVRLSCLCLPVSNSSH